MRIPKKNEVEPINLNMKTNAYKSLDETLKQDYWQLNASQKQLELRRNRAVQFSAVYFGIGDYDVETLTSEFRRMVDLGFNTVRFYTANPEETAPGEFNFQRPDDWFSAAEAAGIGVIFHTEWFLPSLALLDKFKFDQNSYMEAYADDPNYRKILEAQYGPLVERYKEHPALHAWGTLGEPDPAARDLSDEVDRRRFGLWLEKKYGTVEALDQAWNAYPAKGKTVIEAFSEAWQVLEAYNNPSRISGVHRSMFNYGAGRDLREFLTEKALDRGETYLQVYREIDPVHPVLTGSHQLFCNQANHRWDSDRWAKLGDCFTTSIHLSWHFDLVEGEVTRPIYMQARQTRDWFKGGWTSCYETTGGPVQYSGGFGNSMSEGLMRQLVLSYFAAGNMNCSFWVWNSRPGGWEAGEYSLTSLSGRITPWAEEAGRLIQKATAYREELWETGYPPELGILASWDTDAILDIEPPRHDLKKGTGLLGSGTEHQGSRARIGLSRACMNHQISFEYFSERELLDGVGSRYPVIWAPHLRALSDEVILALKKYVESGGTLIADVQFGFLDAYGKLRKTGTGSMHEQIFGAWFENIHDARTGARYLSGEAVPGFYADLETSEAEIVQRFDDGSPAVSRVHRGEGEALLMAMDPAHYCWKPDQNGWESFIAKHLRNFVPAQWSSDHELVYRLRSKQADHFFIMNESAAKTVTLDLGSSRVSEARDLIEDKTLPPKSRLSVSVPANSGSWIRVAYE
jgi:beta-galactosidase